jgi:hypothetical protein
LDEGGRDEGNDERGWGEDGSGCEDLGEGGEERAGLAEAGDLEDEYGEAERSKEEERLGLEEREEERGGGVWRGIGFHLRMRAKVGCGGAEGKKKRMPGGIRCWLQSGAGYLDLAAAAYFLTSGPRRVVLACGVAV